MKTIIFLIIILSTFSTAKAGTSVGFSQVWEMIKSEHPEIEASKLEMQAAESGMDRSNRHWLPRIFAGARGYSTNDPAQNFFGNLGQRSVVTNDFNVSSLNQPGSHSFAQFSLNGELPLYEGGSSSTYSQIQKFNFQSKENLNFAVEIDIYAQSVALYSGLLNAQQSLESLEELKLKVDGVLSRYSLGSRSNPIGYSGLLGLKSVMNRIDASLNSMKLEKLNQRTELLERAKKLSPDWMPTAQKVSEFLEVVLPSESLRVSQESYLVSAQALGADIQNKKISLERSRFLPQIGLFADGNYLLGSRSSGTGYTGGLYLRWSIFNPKDFGVVEESKFLSSAAFSRSKATKINEKLARDQMFQAFVMFNENEKILQDSSKLMNEQVVTASRLFQSGSLNALQMVEVFNRRADLILQIHELHQHQISNRVQLAKTSRMNIKGVEL